MSEAATTAISPATTPRDRVFRALHVAALANLALAFPLLTATGTRSA